MDWYDKAAQEIEDDLTVGDITPEQYKQAMWELSREMREQELENIRGSWKDESY